MRYNVYCYHIFITYYSSQGNTTNSSEIYMKIEALKEDIHKLNKTIKNTGSDVKEFERTLQREKNKLNQQYEDTDQKLTSLQSQKVQMNQDLSSLSTKYQEIWNEGKKSIYLDVFNHVFHITIWRKSTVEFIVIIND